MKKFILAGMAVAMLAIPAVASADVPRYQDADAATFTVTQPKDTTGQFDNVWRHDVQGHGQPVRRHVLGHRLRRTTTTLRRRHGPRDVTGSFGDGTVSFDTDPIGGGATFKVTNAPMNNTTVHVESDLDGQRDRVPDLSRRRPPTRATTRTTASTSRPWAAATMRLTPASACRSTPTSKADQRLIDGSDQGDLVVPATRPAACA